MSDTELFREIEGWIYFIPEEEAIKVCTPIRVSEVGCNRSGEWYLKVLFKDREGLEVERSYPASIFAGSGSDVLKELLNKGFSIDPDGRKYFIKYLYWLYENAAVTHNTNA